MGKLPETIALLVLVLLSVVMSAQLARAVEGDSHGVSGPFQKYWSLSYRRDLSANPPGLLRDIRTAGTPGVAFLVLAAACAGIVAWRTAPGLGRCSDRSCSRALRLAALLALLAAVALAARSWAGIFVIDLLSSLARHFPYYEPLAPGLAIIRLGLLTAIAGHGLALLFDLLAARRASR